VYNEPLIRTLSLLLIVTSLAAVESRNLYRSAIALGAQALLICGLIVAFAVGNHALYIWAGVALVTKATLTPWLIFRYLRKREDNGEEAIIGFGPSVAVASVLLIAAYGLTHKYIGFLAPTPEAARGVFGTNLAVSMTVFSLGLYAILTRRDAVKTVIGLCLLENAVHLSLVSIAPSLRETALVGVATEVVITVALLLYVISGIRDKIGTTDTFELSELHW
jgi:hydrogenase-4 component E